MVYIEMVLSKEGYSIPIHRSAGPEGPRARPEQPTTRRILTGEVERKGRCAFSFLLRNFQNVSEGDAARPVSVCSRGQACGRAAGTRPMS